MKTELLIESEEQTHRLANDLAMVLKAGEFVVLDGDLGAGKTSFARAIIRCAADDPLLEVPSPTFTLVQTYAGLFFGTLTHMDFYRLEEAEEALELGVEEALQQGVVIAEWPQRAMGFIPEPTFEISISQQHDASDQERLFSIRGSAEALARLERSLTIRDFLSKNDQREARRAHLTGDASTRAYETIKPVEDDQTIILMNAPAQPDGPPLTDGRPYSQIAKLAENMDSYVGIASVLTQNGFCPPEIYARDMKHGLFLIEDLGSGKVVDADCNPIPERYLAAVELLADLHACKWPSSVALPDGGHHAIPPFDREAMLVEAGLFSAWYSSHRLGRDLTPSEEGAFERIWNGLIDHLEGCERSLLLRDFHSPNLIWRPHMSGTDRLGLIDFQDALIGPTAYDVASLLQDARVDVSAELETMLLDHYCALRAQRSAFDETGFREAYAIMAAQRATKVAGIFVRLSKRDGKHDYLKHLPRMEGYLRRSFVHPILEEYGAWMKGTFTR